MMAALQSSHTALSHKAPKPIKGLVEGRASFRMRMRKPWMPSLRPPMRSCAKTTAHWACTAELVIQYFCASVVGVWIMNSSAAESYCAVVCISTALLPANKTISDR